jgi:Arc/MetJ-type ribon-helix-helix transcriptional regulator
MAKLKVTITLDETTVAAVDQLVGSGPDANRSAFIETAVAERLQKAARAQRALEWLTAHSQGEHPGEWDAAMEAVRAADARRGYDDTADAGQGRAA